jgi:large subunit ribosomal protein L7A
MLLTGGGLHAEGTVVIGTKQTTKAVENGKAVEVFVAEDADPRIVSRIVQLCSHKGVKLTKVDTMRNLGKACGIEVGAAMAARIAKQAEG